jgi:hypothetical protein
MKALSPHEWERWEKPRGRFQGWRAVVEARPKTLEKLLDELDGQIVAGENPGSKPVGLPLAVLYRKCEAKGIVPSFRKLREMK